MQVIGGVQMTATTRSYAATKTSQEADKARHAAAKAREAAAKAASHAGELATSACEAADRAGDAANAAKAAYEAADKARAAADKADTPIDEAARASEGVTEAGKDAIEAGNDSVETGAAAVEAGKAATTAGKDGGAATTAGKAAINAGKAAIRAGEAASNAGTPIVGDDGNPAPAKSADQDYTVVVAATVGGLTSLIALFAAVGLTANRVAVVFNGGSAKWLLIAALLLAVLSIGLGLLSVVFRKKGLAVALTAGAVAALMLSLGAGVWAASESFTDGGRPTLTKVSVVATGDTQANLTFVVTATGVKSGSLLRAFASWVPVVDQPGQEPGPQLPFYLTTLRPDDMGVVDQDVSVLVDRPATARRVRIQVYWDTSVATTSTPQNSSNGASSPSIPYGAQCANQGDANKSAACAEVVVEAALTPSLTATPTP